MKLFVMLVKQHFAQNYLQDLPVSVLKLDQRGLLWENYGCHVDRVLDLSVGLIRKLCAQQMLPQDLKIR